MHTYIYIYICIYISCVHIYTYIRTCIYIYIYTDNLFDVIAIFSDYHGILKTTFFLTKTVNDYIFLCQETCVYAEIKALVCFKN